MATFKPKLTIRPSGEVQFKATARAAVAADNIKKRKQDRCFGNPLNREEVNMNTYFLIVEFSL